jgi:phosphoribosylformylglycinamidine synthase
MTDEQLSQELGLTRDELALARAILGREPSWTEFGIFGVMWSEHCSYKSSKPLLARLPTSGEHVLEGPGENAGVVALDENLAVAFKIESHNHPSAVEPYQGAATGVGGILRDIFTMGARPIALLDSLHFGPPRSAGGDRAEEERVSSAATGCRKSPRAEEERVSSAATGCRKSPRAEEERVRALVRGVVSGIADYGNCVGVPTVGGETHFDASYQGNPLINVMAVGIVRRDRIALARASTPGARVLYYGNATGRDGIHGATFASEIFEEGGADRRSNVQIGDPFMEKRIMEATLELIEHSAVEGIQDMGAAGLTCSSCEMASRGGAGVRIDLDRLPRRARGMTPYEIMLSESQERMLAVVTPEKWGQARAILEKWGLEAVDLGEVTGDGFLCVEGREREEAPFGTLASIPAARIADAAPVRALRGARPPDFEKRWELDLETIPVPDDLNATLLCLLASPELSSRRWIWEQFDHMVRTSTVIRTVGGDAVVLRVDGSRRALAVTTDSRATAAWLDPRRGAMLAVAEAARNVAAVGARPIAITNNLNFGNPERPEIFWQMEESIEGMAAACRAFETPVTGGNVSLYNEHAACGGEVTAIMPTVVIGMLGVLEDVGHAVGIAAQAGLVFLVGEGAPILDGSEYQRTIHGRLAGRPTAPDLAREKALQEFLVAAAARRLVLAAHDIAHGGLAVTAAEMALAGRTGMTIGIPAERRPDIMLFGEAPGRALVIAEPASEAPLRALAESLGVGFAGIGVAGGARFRIGDAIDLDVSEITAAGAHVLWDLFDVKGS